MRVVKIIGRRYSFKRIRFRMGLKPWSLARLKIERISEILQLPVVIKSGRSFGFESQLSGLKPLKHNQMSFP